MDSSLVRPYAVIGCHGCSRQAAEIILSEQRFRLSTNRYDWLGQGVYFWEYAPYRAMEWARLACLVSGEEPAVLSATIRLGKCINLLDVDYHHDLIATHADLVALLGEERMPRNTARGGNYLDRLVIDSYCDLLAMEGKFIDTIRGTFAEGEPIYPGSNILSLAHTQIAVRNADCIADIQLVTF